MANDEPKLSGQLAHLRLPAQPTPSKGRDGWTRLSLPGDKLGAHWRHDASGWEVRHCSHPTSNYPYHGTDPSRPERVVVTHNGRGFDCLGTALAIVEAIVAGTLVATEDRCGPLTLRVVNSSELAAEIAETARLDAAGMLAPNGRRRGGKRRA